MEWKKYIDFKSILVMQRKEDISELDVAFVEGAITSESQEKKLKQIREVSKKVVAIGSCACSGMPAGQRNTFDESTKHEIEAIITRFSYAPFVRKIADVVPIDSQVPGCPMTEAAFLMVMNKYLVEFGIVEQLVSKI